MKKGKGRHATIDKEEGKAKREEGRNENEEKRKGRKKMSRRKTGRRTRNGVGKKGRMEELKSATQMTSEEKMKTENGSNAKSDICMRKEEK